MHSCILIRDLDQRQRLPWLSIHVPPMFTSHEHRLRGGPAIRSADERHRQLGTGLHIVLHSSTIKVGVKLFTVQIPQESSIVRLIVTTYGYRIEELIQNQTSDRFRARWIRFDCRLCFLNECFAFILGDL